MTNIVVSGAQQVPLQWSRSIAIIEYHMPLVYLDMIPVIIPVSHT